MFWVVWLKCVVRCGISSLVNLVNWVKYSIWLFLVRIFFRIFLSWIIFLDC